MNDADLVVRAETTPASTRRGSLLSVVFQRTAYGALAIAVLIGLFAADVGIAMRLAQADGRFIDLLRRGSVLPAVVLAICIVGAAELNAMLRARGTRPFFIFALVIISLMVLSPWLSAAGWFGQAPASIEGLYWHVVWLAFAFLGLGTLAVFRGRPEGSTADCAVTLLMILYLGFLPSFAIQLRCGRDVSGNDGAWLLLLTLLITKSSDIGAYFVGTAIGRHKLIPSVSPGKSVEGMLGGIATSALVGCLLALVPVLSTAPNQPAPGHESFTFAEGLQILLHDATRRFGAPRPTGFLSPWLRGLLFGAILSAVAQIGDLVESCFKRDAKAKDSGHLIPHFGGILDLIDSPLFSIPVAWFLLTAVFDVI